MQLVCFFIFLILGLIFRLFGFNIFRLLSYISHELLIVLGTSSSESALPSLMSKLKRVGCSGPLVDLVVPTGYSFNLDGTSIYLTMAALFITQAIDQPLNVWQQFSLLLILLITSKRSSRRNRRRIYNPCCHAACRRAYSRSLSGNYTWHRQVYERSPRHYQYYRQCGSNNCNSQMG